MKSLICAALILFALNAHALQPINVSASDYQEPHRAENTLDDRWESRWSCQGTCWIQYDFGSVEYLESVEVHWHNADRRIQTFDVEISTNGERWELVFSGESMIDNTGTDTSPTPTTVHVGEDTRYVRITGYGNSFNDWNSLERIFFYPGDEDIFQPQIVSINASNVVGNNTPDKAHDEFRSTFWTGSGNAPYIEFELDEVRPIFQVNIAWMNGHIRKQRFAIEISIDGENWERIAKEESGGKTQDYENNIFSDMPLAQYVRIIGLGNNSKIAASKKKISITDVEIVSTWLDESSIAGIASSR